MPHSDLPFHEAYLGKRLQDLLDLAHLQMKDVYAEAGLIIPVEGSSTLQSLKPGAGRALADLARSLDQPHQLVAQRLDKLKALKLVTRRADPKDGRRFEYFLTAEGEVQWRLLDTLMQRLIEVNRALFKEIECDLVSRLDDAVKALKSRAYTQRFDLTANERPTRGDGIETQEKLWEKNT